MAPQQTARDRAVRGAELAKTSTIPQSRAGSATTTVAQQRRYIILILTAVLVLLLAIVALWAALSLSTNEAKNSAPSPATVVQQAATPLAAPTAPETQSAASSGPDTATAQNASPLDAATLDGQAPAVADPALPKTAKPESAMVAPAPVEPAVVAPARVPPSMLAPAMVELAPVAKDVTEAAAATVAGPSGQDEIFLAGADTPPVNLDPIALPALQGRADAAPVLPESPPPYLSSESPPAALSPTPEGGAEPKVVLSPNGLPPIAPIGQPEGLSLGPSPDLAVRSPTEPPTEPEIKPAIAPTMNLPAALAPDASALVIAQGVLAQDPSLADRRPLARPADLIPALTPPSVPDTLTPDSRSANLRPQARPADLTSAPPDSDLSGVEGLTLATLPKPQARPTDIGTGTDRAVALNQVPSEQPEAAAPTLPSNASVAKQATEKLALNANRLALLAIFGTPTSRYAMIRLVGGRVKKVQMGDLVDGGRIAGITADTVQYQKGSRIVTLSLPQG